MVRAFLALGSNMGDKVENLREALARLTHVPGVALLAASDVYRTPPWGKLDQDWFANAVVAVETSLSPEALLEAALGVERAMGRVRDVRWGPRLIDIDVLMHGDARRDEEHLRLPHPAMQERAFVLVPLAQIAPGLMLSGESVEAHLARLDRTGIEPMAALAPEPAAA
ncbi:MAG: 2-amino-4-hydroxy-6-hydroxymethyldihydropteridine diphosphokinase [Proteobacteria bacterium]|nr:2-amino-4-hydroxy-6-hydroxymethyldihydropteridine diphosphokinase [Pseudomonadota bacterium]